MTASRAIFWRPDSAVEAARRLSGWRDFHRRCGLQGLFFDSIASAGRAASGYSARAYCIGREAGDLVSHTVAHGSGADVVAALKAALDAAAEAGFAVDDPSGLKALLDAVEPARIAPVSIDELLGIAVAAPAQAALNILELIG